MITYFCSLYSVVWLFFADNSGVRRVDYMDYINCTSKSNSLKHRLHAGFYTHVLHRYIQLLPDMPAPQSRGVGVVGVLAGVQ